MDTGSMLDSEAKKPLAFFIALSIFVVLANVAVLAIAVAVVVTVLRYMGVAI